MKQHGNIVSNSVKTFGTTMSHDDGMYQTDSSISKQKKKERMYYAETMHPQGE